MKDLLLSLFFTWIIIISILGVISWGNDQKEEIIDERIFSSIEHLREVIYSKPMFGYNEVTIDIPEDKQMKIAYLFCQEPEIPEDILRGMYISGSIPFKHLKEYKVEKEELEEGYVKKHYYKEFPVVKRRIFDEWYFHWSLKCKEIYFTLVSEDKGISTLYELYKVPSIEFFRRYGVTHYTSKRPELIILDASEYEVISGDLNYKIYDPNFWSWIEHYKIDTNSTEEETIEKTIETSEDRAYLELKLIYPESIDDIEYEGKSVYFMMNDKDSDRMEEKIREQRIVKKYYPNHIINVSCYVTYTITLPRPCDIHKLKIYATFLNYPKKAKLIIDNETYIVEILFNGDLKVIK